MAGAEPLKSFRIVGRLRSLDGAAPTSAEPERKDNDMTEAQRETPAPEEQPVAAGGLADDDFGIGDILDISDVPLPPEPKTETVDDEIKQAQAFRFCFVGAGQGGGNIAQQFWQYGYRRVCAVNTADADLRPLDLPEVNKFKLHSPKEGAGGNPVVGDVAAKRSREDIFNLMRNCFGAHFDRIFVTVTAGGGTGAGSCEEIVRIAHHLVEKLELQDADGHSKVGVIVALPKEADGREAHRSAYHTIKRLIELTPSLISPLIIIDNQRIDKLYPRTPAGQFWGRANHACCSIFHLLNLVAARESAYTSFDQSDYDSIMRSGLLAYGAMPVTDWSHRDAISTAIRDNLTRNVLVGGMDFSTGTIAGCVVVSSKAVLDKELPQEYLDNGFSMLGRMIKNGSAVRRGIYSGGKDNLIVYTLIGGLAAPEQRLRELARLGGLQDHDGA